MKAPLPWAFLIPPAGMLSGGNLYNERLIAALQEAGVPVLRCADPAQLPAAGTCWADTLLLDRAVEIPPGLARILLVHHLDSLWPPDPGGQSAARDRRRLAGFDALLATSSFTAEYLRTGLQLPQPVYTAEPAPHPGIRMPETLRAAAPVSALMAANLIERKGILPLLEGLAAAGIPPGLPWRLTLCGSDGHEPAYAEACLRLIRSHPALRAHVRWIGSVPPGQLPDYYHEANVFLSAAGMETFGMALQDAVQAGLPVLAVEGGFAARHLAEGITGHAADSPAQLARLLAELIRHPARLEALLRGAAQHRPWAGHTWQSAAQRLLSQIPPV
ncbi:MAG: glycosyltransferase family 4 protein [Bacteroidia bacterium]|nr:glycosyltransferase family 4 protein [Bacteroidia bacterium]